MPLTHTVKFTDEVSRTYVGFKSYDIRTRADITTGTRIVVAWFDGEPGAVAS